MDLEAVYQHLRKFGTGLIYRYSFLSAVFANTQVRLLGFCVSYMLQASYPALQPTKSFNTLLILRFFKITLPDAP